MIDDEDTLPVDLAAWQPPAPPAGLADAVIGRMREPVAAGAVEAEGRTKRRWWIGAAALAAVGAVATVVIVTGARHEPQGHGELVATRAQHVDLGGASADVEAGTEIRWRRDGNGLHVDQPRGTAAWRLDGDEVMRIDAGATVASVEATGGSLRVEVIMNLNDVRLTKISAVTSAVTAAAVALVTVTVYEGRVKAIGGGQSVTIEPGASVEIRPGEAVGAPVVGLADQLRRSIADADQLRTSLAAGAATEAELVAAKLELEKLRAQLQGVTAPSAGCDEVSCVLGNYEGACCAPYQRDAMPLDKAVIDSAIRGAAPAVASCFRGHPSASLLAHFDVTPAGTASHAAVEITDGPADKALVGCIARVVASVRFPKSRVTTKVSYPFVFASPAREPAAPCDADTLKLKADADHSAGLYAQALLNYEKAMACKPGLDLHAQAGMEACKSKNVDKARRYFQSVSPSRQTGLKQICLREGIELTVADAAACDADALKLKGDSDRESGNFARALVNYDSAMACRPGFKLDALAELTACKGKDAAKARQYYQRLSAGQKLGAKQQCLTNGIDLDAPACDADALKQKGDADHASGLYAQALAEYEKAIACRADPAFYPPAFLDACKSKNAAKARRFYSLLTPNWQGTLRQVCVDAGIDPKP
jgi:tetratricopeptide (TPR) repeat protein